MEFGHKVIQINPAWCPSMIFGHHDCFCANISSLLVQGSNFGIQKRDLGPKNDGHYNDQDPKLMFFGDTLIETIYICNMKKIGDLLQFHIGTLYQKIGLKVFINSHT